MVIMYCSKPAPGVLIYKIGIDDEFYYKKKNNLQIKSIFSVNTYTIIDAVSKPTKNYLSKSIGLSKYKWISK